MRLLRNGENANDLTGKKLQENNADEQFGELKYKDRNREFWCRGYYVDTVGKNTSRIAEYIQNQLKEDELGEQLTMSQVGPFTGSK